MTEPATPDATPTELTEPAAAPTPPPTSVVFLHGAGQMPQAWQEQVTALPPDWRCSAPWLQGLKPTDTDPFALDPAVDAVLDRLQASGVRRTHLVGHSLGAVVALRVAAREPDVVDRLVLIAGQVAPPRLLMRAQLALMRRLPEARFARDHLSKERVIAAMEALKDLDLHADLRRVTSPTLVVIGTKDRPNQPAAKALAKGIAGAELVELPGGHALNTESPQALNEALLRFLTPAQRPAR